VKSGVVTYEVSMTMNGKTISTNRNIVSFDDYGLKERQDKYDKGVLVGSSLTDGKSRYELIHKNKTYFEVPAGPGSMGVAYRARFEDIPEKDRTSGKAKKLPNETLLGKPADVYTFGEVKFVGWNGILLLHDQKVGSNMRSVQKAVKIEETSVPAHTFTVPAGYTKTKSPF
jgi:hypothetical protein